MKVLVVHSSADLYGSDRSLLDFVRLSGPDLEISVVLSEQGPLVERLRQAGARVEVGEVCKVQRSMFSPRGFLKACASAWRSLRLLRRLGGAEGYDVVYSNTVAIFGGALYALVARRPHVWHVREIVESSPKLAAAFRLVVGRLSSRIICNSNQTRDWIATAYSRSRCAVIWNGVGRAEAPGTRDAERAAMGVAADELLFVLVGRINSWKGQALLVDAFVRLCEQGQQGLRLAIVGSAYTGQEHFERELKTKIEACAYAARISLLPFRSDVDAIWEAADVVVVPSTEPEPFGRVAIEAMAHAKPVIAAAHGGLLDIVANGETGLLFEPRSVEALAAAMASLANDAPLRARMGPLARERQARMFSVEAYAQQVTNCLRKAAA